MDEQDRWRRLDRLGGALIIPGLDDGAPVVIHLRLLFRMAVSRTEQIITRGLQCTAQRRRSPDEGQAERKEPMKPVRHWPGKRRGSGCISRPFRTSGAPAPLMRFRRLPRPGPHGHIQLSLTTEQSPLTIAVGPTKILSSISIHIRTPECHCRVAGAQAHSG